MDSIVASIAHAIVDRNLEAVSVNFNAMESDFDRKSIIDNEIRARFAGMLEKRPDDKILLNFIEFTFSIAQKGFCNVSTPIGLMADLFDCTPISRCKYMFAVVEKHLPEWKSEEFQPTRNSLLRLCNDLMRRLSSTTDTVFCGRILVLLARCLPLTEKSGLNITGQFNVENVTKFDAIDSSIIDVSVENSEKITKPEPMEMEEGEMHDDVEALLDYNLYKKFWQLQLNFSQPNSCYDKTEWAKFSENSTEVLNVFSSHKLEGQASLEKQAEIFDSTILTDAMSSPAMSLEQSTHFAKYLTSQKLLQLQLNDNSFRRYVLVQFLILCQYLLADVKFKDRRIHVLSDEQIKIVLEKIDKCYNLLKETYPNGQKFAAAIKHILLREERWNKWKNATCEDVSLKVKPEKVTCFKRKKKEMFSENPMNLGNPILTQLWTTSADNYDACKSLERQFIPELDAFLETPLEQMDPTNCIEEQYKVIKEENFQWRALRLMALKSPRFFSVQPASFNGSAKMVEKLLINTAKTIPKFKETIENIEKATKEALEATRHESNHNANEENRTKVVSPVNGESKILENGDLLPIHTDTPGTYDYQITESQISSLATIIGENWPRLARQIDGISNDSIEALKKKQVPEEAAQILLSTWLENETNQATVKCLRNLLLKAELINEEVTTILSQKVDDNDIGSVRSEVTGSSVQADDQDTPLRDETLS